jgi:hypothetical protein
VIPVDLLELVKNDFTLSVRYLKKMNDLMNYDTKQLLEICRAKNTGFNAGQISFDEYQFWHRALLRAFFAHVEGIAYLMRQLVLWATERSEIALNEKESLLLAEIERRMQDGQVVERTRFNTAVKNVELAFEYFPRLFRRTFHLNKGGDSWRKFKRALEIRHAVTHPKTPEEFMLSGEAVAALQGAIIWFSGEMERLLAECSSGPRPS